jgi:pimeloyl-ACP methyl ester carboxylesterase
MSRLARRLPIVVSLALGAALAVATPVAGAGTTRPAAAAAASVPLPHDDAFYAYDGSTPLKDIAPGTVLKTRSVTVGVPGTGVGALPGTQLLYRTQDEQGHPTVTVTTVVNPTGPLATGVVSYLSFYDALGDGCDPSFTLRGGDPGQSNAEEADAEAALVLSLATEGYAVTVPDFEGEGLHWVAGQESGWNTLDAVRATESYLGMASTEKVGLFGYSGGSIAGEWAAELAPAYSPELNIVGTAIGGIPVDLAHNTGYINGSSDWSGVIPAVLVALSRAFGINTAKYESAYGKKVTSAVSDECIGSFNGAYPGLRVQQLLKKKYHAFLKVPVFARVANKLIMGSAPGQPTEPMLLGVGNVDGTGDGVMIENDVMALGHEYCGQGVPVQFITFPGSAHTQAGLQFFPQAEEFLAQRFLGTPFASNCSDIGVGNSLAPLKVRKRHHHHHHHHHHGH